MMDLAQRDSRSADDGVILLTRANVASAARRYPFAIRQALTLGTSLEFGRLDVTLPDGAVFRISGAGPGPEAALTIHDHSFARKLAQSGEIGVAESFMAGGWDTPDLTAFLELFCVNQAVLQRLMADKPLVRWAQLIRHWLNRNTRAGSRRNIFAHYDLGNSFYQSWLDETMTYSSGLFTTPRVDLAAAQTAKFAALAQETGIGPQDHVLEIGCGWGGFAEWAARDVGCRVTGLTISQQQFDFAQKRIFEAGLNERVEIKLQDYRDATGVFDRIASIEMFEAVGEQYWPTFFDQVRDRLAAGGRAGLQVITIRDDLFDHYSRELDFIRRYIFPGGMLPTGGILRDLGARHGLRVTAERVFGADYALTLAQWRERFRAAWPRIRPLGFDERFRRLWEYYFAYCEAGFRSGTIDVRHVVYAKP